MDKADIFPWLVEYNLRTLDRLVHDSHTNRLDGEGRIIFQRQPIKEMHENELCKGFLLFVNGESLRTGITEGQVKIGDRAPVFEPFDGISDLFRIIESQLSKDGCYVADLVNEYVARTPELNNAPVSLPPGFTLLDKIPADFLVYNGNSLSQEAVDDLHHVELGGKKRQAIRIPCAFPNTDAYQVKRTGYTPLGMGKVTHFTNKGLTEELFFQYVQMGFDVPYALEGINEDHGIIAVHRTYEMNPETGRVRKTGEYAVDPRSITDRVSLLPEAPLKRTPHIISVLTPFLLPGVRDQVAAGYGL